MQLTDRSQSPSSGDFRVDEAGYTNEQRIKRHARRQIEKAHERWAAFETDQTSFLPFAAQRWPREWSPQKLLDSLRWEELYLVYACLGGCRTARDIFEQEYLRPLKLHCRSTPNIDTTTDDIRHHIWEKLFCGTDTQCPKLQQYKGIGSLAGWLQTIAYRELMQLFRQRSRQSPLYTELSELCIEHNSPEMLYVKHTYLNEFKEALQQTLCTLSAKERNILRYHYMEGWTMEKLSKLYGVHRSTISRQLSQLQTDLLRNTLRHMEKLTGLTKTELQRMAQMMQSQMELSLQRILVSA